MNVIRCEQLINPGVEPVSSVRIQIEHGFVTDISDVPSDETRLIEPIAVLPGLINAHTHLEFSNIREPLKPTNPFPDWIRSVISHRNQNQPDPEKCVRVGMQEATATGTSFVGEICTSTAAATQLQQDDCLAAVCFREVLSFSGDRVDEQTTVARDFLNQTFASHVQPGLSPHAPYTVHPELFHNLIDLAKKQCVPVAMHLAESPSELEMLNSRSGAMVQFLTALNLWDSSILGSTRNVMPYLERLAELPHSLAVHCNYLTDEEHRYLCQNPHVAVVYCPRTHQYFGHSVHPWRSLKEQGATVVLGTDSRASNPDLNLLKEVQFVAKASGVPLHSVLPMVTTESAGCFGLDADDYRIRVGGKANLFCVPLTDID